MQNKLFDLAVYACFLCLCLIGVRKSSGDSEQDYLTRFNALRGIFALEIVLGHAVRHADSYLWPFGRFMMISVGFFFFVSAFGMVHSYHRKNAYLEGFCKRKIGYLFCLTIVVFAFNFVADLIIPANASYVCDISQIPQYYLIKTNWYMFEQMLFYALFYLVYQYLKKGRILAIAVAILLLDIVVYQLGWDQEWYASSWSFVAGLIVGEHYLAIQKAVKKPWMWCVSFLLAALGIISLFVGENIVSMLFLRNIMCIATILILFQLLGYIQLGNSVTVWLGRYSTEIYLFQFLYLRIAENTKLDYKISVLFMVSLTMLTAVCARPVFEWIRRKCAK